ncbi:hypothetical protein [Georgenia sp. AZ-5]|uniref:hypothetical protein n=1 Tax=Georgenia sp. AZ-5 TaxID=3367526 RepID=UPI003754E06E
MTPGSTIALSELDTQAVELLPSRETLLVNVNIAPVVGVNLAFAFNILSDDATANAFAVQQIFTVQEL